MSNSDKAEVSEHANNVVTRVAEAAMKGAEEVAEASGVKIGRMFFSVHLQGSPDDEPDATGSAGGQELSSDPLVKQRQLFELTLSSARALGAALGYDVEVVTRGPQA